MTSHPFSLTTLLVFVLSLSSAPLYAKDQVIEGSVVGIADGDTLTVLDASNVQNKIRLADPAMGVAQEISPVKIPAC